MYRIGEYRTVEVPVSQVDCSGIRDYRVLDRDAVLQSADAFFKLGSLGHDALVPSGFRRSNEQLAKQFKHRLTNRSS